MPVGFQSFVSGTSIVQIDADGPPVLQLLAYGTISMLDSGGYRTAYVGLPPNLSPSNTLVFVKPGVGGQAKIINFFIDSPGIIFESDINQTTLEYYIFGPPISFNSGLELRNSSGGLVFSSNNKPCVLENLWTNVSYSSPPTMLVDSNTAICTKNDVSYCYASGPGPGGIGFTNYYRRKLPYYSGNNVLWNIIFAMDSFADSFTPASVGDVSKSTVISTKVGDVNIGATDYTIDSVNWPDVSGTSGTFFTTSTQVISGTEVPVILSVSVTSDGFPTVQFTINGTNTSGSNVLVYPGQSIGFRAFRGTIGSNTVTVTNVNTGTTVDTFVITFTASGNITGSLSSTLGGVAISGTGSSIDAISGSLSSTLGDVTVSGSGSVVASGIGGSLSSTLGDVTISGTGSVPFIGSLSSTLGDVTVSGTGNTFVPTTVTRTSGTGATETVPTGATSVRIRVGGGGGAGGCRGSLDTGGGGGEGGFAELVIAVTGGNTMTYTVGAAVAGRSTAGAGTNGNASSVSGTVSGGSVSMTANGGAGGFQITGGAGGTASGGSTNTTGAPGEDSGSGSAGGSGNSTQSGAGGAGSLAPDPSGDGIRGEIEFYYT